MTSSESRKNILSLIDESITSGCRQNEACEAFNIEVRTLQRWRLTSTDQRCGPNTVPMNKLTIEERELVIKTSVLPEWKIALIGATRLHDWEPL